jgi:hypothetical protein
LTEASRKFLSFFWPVGQQHFLSAGSVATNAASNSFEKFGKHEKLAQCL